MAIVLGPDVLVNASVALGSPPEKVVKRLLGSPTGHKSKTTDWILERVEAMLFAVPEFKNEAVKPHVATIRKLMDVVRVPKSFAPDAWEDALVAAARAAGASRVLTDHPDLLTKEMVNGVEFVSTDAWLIEQSIPPPPPPVPRAS